MTGARRVRALRVSTDRTACSGAFTARRSSGGPGKSQLGLPAPVGSCQRRRLQNRCTTVGYIMEISGEYFIGVPRERVWAALNDPAILRTCIPGCRSLERVSPTTMRSVVEARVGPLTATFNGTLTQSEIDAPRACRLTAQGDGGASGSAKGTADVTLTPEGSGTRLKYTAHAEVGGKLAAVGNRAIDLTAKQMADQFFGAFATRVGEGPIMRAEHAVEEAAHEVAEV